MAHVDWGDDRMPDVRGQNLDVLGDHLKSLYFLWGFCALSGCMDVW